MPTYSVIANILIDDFEIPSFSAPTEEAARSIAHSTIVNLIPQHMLDNCTVEIVDTYCHSPVTPQSPAYTSLRTHYSISAPQATTSAPQAEDLPHPEGYVPFASNPQPRLPATPGYTRLSSF